MTTHNLILKYKDLCMKYPSQRDTFYRIVNSIYSQIDTDGESPQLIQDGIKKLEKSLKKT